MAEQPKPITIVLKDVENMSHFGVIRDWTIRLKSGQEIELSAEVVEQIIKHENEEAGYVKLAEDQSLPDNPIGDFIPDIGKGQQWAYNKAQRDMLKAGWRKVDTQEGK